MTIAALDVADRRTAAVEVAGVAALLVAKAHKIHDRVASGRVDRLSDKDAADVYRIMQTTPAEDVAGTRAASGQPDPASALRTTRVQPRRAEDKEGLDR